MQKMQKKWNVRKLTLMGLLTALLLVLSLTPLGYLKIGPLSATLNMIPVAVAAIALGPTGSAILGIVFGLTSFYQALMGGDGLSVILMQISPLRTMFLCIVPRLLMGFLVGVLFKLIRKHSNMTAACYVTGFLAAFLNTVFFMSALLLLFGNTEYLQGMIGGQNLLLFVCAFVGINAVFEMIVSTVISGILGTTLGKAKLLSV